MLYKILQKIIILEPNYSEELITNFVNVKMEKLGQN